MFLFMKICILFTLFTKMYCDNSRPNIIMIMADDMGWNDVGFHGSNQISTPNIDALGYNGVIFDRYYSQHICTPSRAAFLTGNYPIRSGFQGFPMSAGENRTLPHSMKTLPGKLKDLGYKTHLVGKWHLGYGYKNATPNGHCFDTFYGYYNGYIGYFNHEISQFPLISGLDFHRNFEPVVDQEGTYATDLFTKETENIINNSTNDPFFIFLSHLAPHTGKTIAPGVTVLEVADINEVNRKYSYIKDVNRRMFADIVERLDASVGSVMSALSKKDLLKNTIVVFVSDNGAQTFGMHENHGSNWPLRGLKTTLFEGGIKVPAVLYSTKLTNKGTINKNLFHITDWYPTLYAAAGGKPEDLGVIDGVNHWESIINGKNEHKREEIFLNIDEALHFSGIIGYNGQFKLINNSIANNTYDVYAGESGRSILRQYDFNAVLISKTNEAIENIKGTRKLNPIVMLHLRKQVTMKNCRGWLPDKLKCTGMCLFDLFNDPCETSDISRRHPTIVNELWSKIQYYQTKLIPQQNSFVDLNADPRKCGNTWFSWLENDGCWYNTHSV